jgi:hypothetical protein
MGNDHLATARLIIDEAVELFKPVYVVALFSGGYDSLAESIVQNFPHAVQTVDADMTLISTVYEKASHSVGIVDEVRAALAAAGRLQGMALLLQAFAACQQYTFLVEYFTHWLDNLDTYLCRLRR